nr:thaumatin-like protein 1 [Quercus suber]
MMKTLALYGLTLAFFFLSGAHSAKITFTNNCSKTIWPGTLTSDLKPQLSNTGFELLSKASLTLDVQAPWKGRFWARTQCSTNSTNFTCETADCGTGKVACNGTGAIPPASLVEINIADNRGMDYYDVSLVDGFNLPVSVATRGGTGDCKNSSCPRIKCIADLAVNIMTLAKSKEILS